MNQQEFNEKIRKALGTTPHMDVRQSLGQLMRGDVNEIWLSYEWVKDRRFFKWIYQSPEVDFGESSTGVRVWLISNETLTV